MARWLRPFRATVSVSSNWEMAQAIQQAITDNATLVTEAGTGTGKTFAYLVPALLSGGKVIISTGTKNPARPIIQSRPAGHTRCAESAGDYGYSQRPCQLCLSLPHEARGE